MPKSLVVNRGPRPLYSQLEELIRADIENGKLQPHDALPSETDLAKQLGLARMTVRHALERLVAQGLLYRVPSKGTFVAEPKLVQPAFHGSGLRSQIERLGYTSETELVEASELPAPHGIAAALAVAEGTPVYRVQRVRKANGSAIALDTSYLLAPLFPALLHHDLSKGSLYDLLAREYGVTPTGGEELLEAALASPNEAGILGVKAGSPLLLLHINMHDQHHQRFEHVQVMIRGDRVRLRIDSQNSEFKVWFR